MSKLQPSLTESAIHQVDPNPATLPAMSPSLETNYEVLETLGQGGMGTVYKVFDRALKKVFAVKVLRPELSQDAQTRKRFQQEAAAISKLTHPNLASVYDQGITSYGAPYLVMGYVEGKSLAQILSEVHHLDAAKALELFIQISDSVQYAHEHGIVHRDLKPSNIIISNEGQAHIVDFGIAKILPVNHSRETQNLTNTGEVFGSPAYMSPEQGMGYNLEARSDIYSLGCVMYQTVTGRVPFEAINPIQTIVQHLSEKPPPMNTRIYGQSVALKSLEQVILKCLEKDPSDRYQSLKDLQLELTRIQNGKKITARARKEERLLTRAGIAKIALAVLLNVLVVTSAIGQYESSLKEKRREEQLISSANALSKLMYDAGVALGGYSITKNALFKDRFNKISALIPAGVKSLQELSAGNEERAMKAIEDASDKGLRTLNEAKEEVDSNNETSDKFRQRHAYKEIREIADDLQKNLQILTAKSHSDLADTNFEKRIKFILMLELLALFVADIILTISMMREVQRTARRQIWRIKN